MLKRYSMLSLLMVTLASVGLAGCSVQTAATSASNEAVSASQLQYLVDRKQIEDVIKLYALSIDDKDWDQHKSIFTPTYLSYHKKKGRFVEETVEGRVEFLKRFTRKFRWTQHIASIYAVDIEGDSAFVVSTLNARHKRPPAKQGEKQKNDLHMLGQYHYWLTRTDAGWKIDKIRLNRNRNR